MGKFWGSQIKGKMFAANRFRTILAAQVKLDSRRARCSPAETFGTVSVGCIRIIIDQSNSNRRRRFFTDDVVFSITIFVGTPTTSNKFVCISFVVRFRWSQYGTEQLLWYLRQSNKHVRWSDSEDGLLEPLVCCSQRRFRNWVFFIYDATTTFSTRWKSPCKDYRAILSYLIPIALNTISILRYAGPMIHKNF